MITNNSSATQTYAQAHNQVTLRSSVNLTLSGLWPYSQVIQGVAQGEMGFVNAT